MLSVVMFMVAEVPSSLYQDSKRAETEADSLLAIDSLPPVDSLLSVDSLQPIDSLLPVDSLLPIDSLLPDTAKMDSLELAIWKHNKAIDDSLRADSINRQRKNGIDSPVDFSADDSLIYEAGSGMAFLYGNSHVKYQNMDLQSERIYMSLDSSLVHATGARDTATGEMIGMPVFQMGSDTYESDTMAFNFKTKKGLIQQVYTEQQHETTMD